jgi:hypothetical protein
MRILKTIIFLLWPLLMQAQSLDSVYNFPIRPGTKEWSNLNTEEQRIRAMQIPDNLLKQMSTECLIKTCINYPAFVHFSAFDDRQKGIQYVIDSFNGLKELLNRKDAPLELIKIYSSMDKADISFPDKKINKRYGSIRSCYFEMILTQDAIIDKMDENTRLEFITEARRRLDYKADNNSSGYSFYPTFLIMGKILDKSSGNEFQSMKATNENMKRFIEKGSSYNEATIDEIIRMTDNYIKSKTKKP